MLLETPEINLGWAAQPFELDDFNQQSFSWDQVKGKNGTLIAFICNHCPYVKAIIDRIVVDAKTLQENGIGVVAINSNDYRHYTEDSPENMKLFAHVHGMSFPYLVDEQQEIAKKYGAVCTPDFFGFNAQGQLQYRGRLDSAGMQDPTNRVPELRDAMLAIAKTHQGPAKQNPSMGCSIKWKNS